MTNQATCLVASLLMVLSLGCGDDSGTNDNGLDAGADAALPIDDTPLSPALGSFSTEPVDCTGAYELPPEFTGPDGLGHHGWTLEDLTFSLAWTIPNTFENDWLSRNDNSVPSMRVRPWLVPEAGYCYQEELAASTQGAAAGASVLGALLRHMTAFSHPETGYDALERDVYTSPAYDLGGRGALLRAIRGLWELPNALPDAPETVGWDAALRAYLEERIELYPEELDRAVARLVLALGEAYLIKWQALSAGDPWGFKRIFDAFQVENYAANRNAYVSPQIGTVTDDILEHAPTLNLRRFYAAALAVVDAADRCREALQGVLPFASPRMDLLTSHGRILIDTTGEDNTYSAEELADAVLVIDLGGNDIYHGRYAATHEFWMSASVLIDVAGDDQYTPEAADIEDASTLASDAFDKDHGFTQGCGLFGVGVLLDAAGNDRYTASVHAQGNGAFGVGVLYDQQGIDSYRLGTSGQGTGYFGIGLALDAEGDDYYGAYTVGQGVGKPAGHGLLLDLDGHDTYIGYYVTDGSHLAPPGFNDYSASAYSDSEGRSHNMSVVQGVGWGFRGDWFTDEVNWMGGFGALVDLGDGDDEHYADCMAMGQGFVYGFGFLYDGGGNDKYRTFWWGPAAAAHMGVGLLIEEDGDDDFHVSRLSGGYGYDCGVGWTLDLGGNDTYSGQFNYGRAYTWGMTFMINIGGDDVYNADASFHDPGFGYVDTGLDFAKLIGVFMDLGGGNDVYNTGWPGIGNNSTWYITPVGDGTSVANHKGIGIDQ